jgi:hypothetical protein
MTLIKLLVLATLQVIPIIMILTTMAEEEEILCFLPVVLVAQID